MSKLLYLLALAVNLGWLAAGDCLTFWEQLAVPVATAGLILLATCLELSGTTAQRRRAWKRGLWALLLYYLAILSVLLFFGGLFHLDRAWGGAVNLEPFRTIRNYLIHYRRTGSFFSLLNLLGNIAILIPLGILLPVLFRPMRRFWLFLPLAAAVALGVEYLQWKTGAGVADIDDSILNFAGAALGYFATRFIQILGSFFSKG